MAVKGYSLDPESAKKIIFVLSAIFLKAAKGKGTP
jgi:hypothetical protein